MIQQGAGPGVTLSFRERDPETPFALGASARTWGNLWSDVAAVRNDLVQRARGENSPLMVACGDRYAAAVALCACWRAGHPVALPPSGNPSAIDQLCTERRIPLVLHDGGGAGGLDIRGLMGTRAEPAVAPMMVFAPERLLICVYTSGSTGDNLACPKTAGQILGEARLLSRLFSMGPEARILATVPPHHIYGLLFGLLVPLMGGGAIVRGTPHHAEAIAEQVRIWRANVLVSVPAHLHGLAMLSEGTMPPTARVFSSGAPLPPRTAAAVAARVGTRVTEVYGSSETGGIAWRQAMGREVTAGTEPWQPFPGVGVEAGDGGAIVVTSPFAAGGGGEGDGATKGRFVGADHVAPHADGRFDLLGRADGVVKIGGSRTSTTEVERRLLDLPGVRDAAVVSVDVPGPRQHELWAVVAAPPRPVAELRAALARSMDAISIPRRFRVVDTLPREDNGKLPRRRVLALFGTAPAPDDGDLATDAAPRAPARATAVGGLPATERHALDLAIPVDSPYFQGHFRGFPVLPGVVQVNDIVLTHIRARWPDLQRLRRIVALKFRNPIRPGDTVSLKVTRSDAGRVAFQLRGPGDVIASSGTCVFEPQAPANESAR
ncbi:MAG: AMP-binding protein [Bacteroidota bacterium]